MVSDVNRDDAMRNVSKLIECYVAVWNEANAEERRRRIRALWAPDGATCYRLSEARGYDAIEARVAGSWDKWLRGGKYIFRAKSVACHHDVVKFDWLMVARPGGGVEASGLSFLILDSEGRVRADYQFNPTVDEASALVEQYLAVWNESDAEERRCRIAELWAENGAQVSATSVHHGRSAIEAKASKIYDAYGAKGLVFAPSRRSHAHHDVVSFQWQRRSWEDAAVEAAGCDLLILDADGRICLDYQYEEPIAEQRGGSRV